MSLSGSFDTMPLKDLSVYLSNKGASGIVTLERAGVRKQFALDEGQVVNASSNQPREFLGQFLINLGHITEEQFHRAYETQTETKVFLGRILVMIGLCTEEIINTVLSLKFRETILEAYTWPEGTFSFEPGPPPPVDGLELKIPLTEIMQEGDFREMAWSQFRNAFPSGDVTLELVRSNLAMQPKSGSLDERLLSGIDAGQTIDELALALHATDFFLYQRLFALHRLQALKVADRRMSRPSSHAVAMDLGLGDSPSAEQLLANARVFYAKGNHRDAHSLAKHSHQLTATLDAQLLLKQIEAAWGPKLKSEILAKPRHPKVTIDEVKMAQANLSAPERYLLSRLDGKRDLEGIIRVAPLKEFDVLAYFDRFVAQGWVTL
jgi:hypothetical protein